MLPIYEGQVYMTKIFSSDYAKFCQMLVAFSVISVNDYDLNTTND